MHLAFGTPVRDALSVLINAGWSVAGSIAFGALAGAVFTLYLRYVGREITLVFLALCAVLTAFSAPLGFEPFLTGLAAGAVVQNAMPQTGDVLHDAVEYGAMPVLVLFFAALGASMHVEAIATVGVIAAGLATWRLMSLRAGTRVAAHALGLNSPEVGQLWRALLPMAGVAIGLVAVLAAEQPGWGTEVQTVVLAVAAISQLAGPILFRASLVQAREIGRFGGLVVVSNREPWIHERAPSGEIVVRSSPGGVSVALDALMRERGGVWIAHGAGSADRDVVDENSSVEVPPDSPAYRLRRLWLTRRRRSATTPASRTARCGRCAIRRTCGRSSKRRTGRLIRTSTACSPTPRRSRRRSTDRCSSTTITCRSRPSTCTSAGRVCGPRSSGIFRGPMSTACASVRGGRNCSRGC